MLNCFSKKTESSLPIYLFTAQQFSDWLSSQSFVIQNWAATLSYKAAPGAFMHLINEKGEFSGIVLGIEGEHDVWHIGALPLQAPLHHSYYIANKLTAHDEQQALIAWGLGAYQFTRYKKPKREAAKLVVPKNCYLDLVENIIESTYLVRDLINTPAEDMTPHELAEATFQLGEQFGAQVTQIIGEDLLHENYPAIFTVGRASFYSPRLIELNWGDKKAPKLTLVGKGVCFDTGGLNIKVENGMSLMKKDMGGAAHALGLARMLMKANLPINLRVLIPAVENAVSGDSYRPGDIITMRNGKTVEITNTDAEGRLILADALTEASKNKPELLIDFATLTGAARVAVGTEIAALFTNQSMIAQQVMAFAEQESDPIWSLPLYKNYLKLLDSQIADMTNCASGPYGGAITAAVFLQQFVDSKIPWMHFDIMAWNTSNRAGHPVGGEAMGLRAMFGYLRQRFSAQH